MDGPASALAPKPRVTPKLLVTHNGKFHCDEVFAYVVLAAALGLSHPGQDHTLVRTRDASIIARADIAWDVGSVHDPSANRFDHHQRGAPLRDDGTPFSAAGLVWMIYGERAIVALLPDGDRAFAGAIATELDDTLVHRIDEIDNGVAPDSEPLGFAPLIGEYNPPWDRVQNDEAADRAFLEAASFARGALARRVDVLRARHAAERHVVAAHANAEDKRLLVLDRGMPWKGAVFAHDLPVLFCVSPVANGNWAIEAMPPEPGSFAQRLPLPKAWAGLEHQALADISGVPDAVFVHLRRFIGAAGSRDGALAMARMALGNAPPAS